MTLKTVVAMSANGRVTIPARAREILHVQGETTFEMEVTEHEVILRPAAVIPREDLWAYTPEHRESLRRALQQVDEGCMRPASETALGEEGEGVEGIKESAA